MAKKKEKMTRQVRAYENTARFIELLIRREPTKSYADILEEWAERLYPDSYKAFQEKMEVLDEMVDRESGKDDK